VTRATPFLLIELNRDPASHAPTPTCHQTILATGSGGEVLADERGHARLNQRLEIGVVDCGEGKVKYIKGDRPDGGEVAMEEDEVEDTWQGEMDCLAF
jgi:hypothetical protein